jgi:putative chitinase
MIALDLIALRTITPGAQEVYRQAFEHAGHLRAFGVYENARRLEHFLAQTLHETGGLRVLMENLNYSAKRLMQVWPSRFKTLAQAKGYEHNPRALANNVYANRMGNVDPNDGWRFVGRGLLQLTGRENYARAGAALGVNFLDEPTLVLAPEHALRVAGYEWRLRRCNEAADSDDLEKVTRLVNGGVIGLEDRRAWLEKVRARGLVVERADEGGA